MLFLKVLSINLCQKDSIVGTVYFELDEFCNDLVVKREFYKYIESRFSESQTNKILNCGFDVFFIMISSNFLLKSDFSS